MLKKIILIGLGLFLLFTGGQALMLITMGDITPGVIVKAEAKSVKTQMSGQRRSIHKATGYYYIKTAVDYRFNVYPTPVEALQRLSEAPLAENILGSDLIVELSRDADSSYSQGSKVDIIHMHKLPYLNAVYQPNRLKTYGGLKFAGGLILLVWGIKGKAKSSDAEPEDEEEREE